MSREKIYKDELVGDVVLRKNPRSRRISLHVHPVKGVWVSLPWYISYEAALEFFLAKRAWVLKTLSRQDVFHIGDGTIVKTLISEIVFIGDGKSSSDLQIKNINIDLPAVPQRLFLSLDSPAFRKEVHFSSGDFADTDELSNALMPYLIEILRDEAKNILPKKLSVLAKRYGFTYNRVTIKHNSSNWGSCSRLGNINLNLNLVRLPEPVCDYVLLHELAHLRYPDHGKAFHGLLEELCSEDLDRLSLVGCTDISSFNGSGNVHKALEREVKRYRLL